MKRVKGEPIKFRIKSPNHFRMKKFSNFENDTIIEKSLLISR